MNGPGCSSPRAIPAKISEGSATGTPVEQEMFGLAQLHQALLFLYIGREELIFCAIG